MDSIDGNGSTKASATTLYFLRIPILAPRYIRLDKRGIFRVAVLKRRKKSLVISHQSLVISHQSSVISHQSLVISHQSLVISHQSLVISHQSLVIRKKARFGFARRVKRLVMRGASQFCSCSAVPARVLI
ncbi:MAG: hypothetical protein EAZ60_02205 [Oscillatoriales cyanobacterium]|nr:MAG: hypothetical protein EAZ83_16850 [Oscillatoriales cyanobacterium]TAE96430.1 MAG: hypothetical protein EAZ79_14585 [Oscillatoriales cyanobacterium]TAF18340.1 MAG: hypothetical protein EAZ73_18150 [Oscillatoriales cyanobacterium]TAF33579.1 MAG: hypothetical protein EAZ69_16050 [Oscillatoriales cyanobacterium]TAF58637.1 MAG: hypothetical protein EAZ60_02205 [Oscillatoriales cyanobacterium]